MTGPIFLDSGATDAEIELAIEHGIFHYLLTDAEYDAIRWIGERYAVSKVLLDATEEEDRDGYTASVRIDTRDVSAALTADDVDRVPYLSASTTLARIVWTIGPCDDDDFEGIAHARDLAGTEVAIEVNAEPSELEVTEEGWMAFVTVWCDRADAYRDQSIKGSSWEHAGDDQCYSSIMLSGPETDVDSVCDDSVVAAYDAMIEKLTADGYDVTVLS